jgi:integrase
MINGKAREMGLGPVELVTLAEAREKAIAARKRLLDGIDPLDERRALKAARAAKAAAAMTFRTCAERFIKNNQAGWRNAKHAAQWGSTLTTYVYPTIGELSVGEIDTGHITKILEPVWTTKPETASRVRGRIESVLDYARVHQWREGENPARWKGHLENVLPKKSKVRAVEHHAALPWKEIGAFMSRLQEEAGTAALALQFTILTAARTGEVIGARWNEIDLDEATWIVSAENMKAGKEHRVPLSLPALAILAQMKEEHGSAPEAFIFPGRGGKMTSNMSMAMLLRRMKREDLTVHGFRSSFRDWAAEATTYRGDIAEAALAHAIDSKVEAAYRRGDLFEKRAAMMKDWAEHCDGGGA